jgi:hypothetical protein
MRRRSFACLTFCLFSLACKSDDTGASAGHAENEGDRLELTSDSHVLATHPDDVTGDGRGEKTVVTKTYSKQRKLKGFDAQGPLICWSLAPEYDCIVRPDSLITSCQMAGGTIDYCDDCRPLCSVGAAVLP